MEGKKKSLLPVVFFPLFTLALWSPSLQAATSLAQADDRIYEEPGREAGEERRAIKAGEQSKERRLIEGAPVTYADILADPDNAELNFLFAKQQIREGDVKGAAGTLERILLLNPAEAEIRLFYGIVLFRLDDVDGAERELNLVLTQGVSDSLSAQAEEYLDQIALRQKRTRFMASLSIGWHYDNNRTAGPNSKKNYLFGGYLNVDGPLADTGMLTIGSLSVVHDLGFQDGHEVTGSFTYLRDRQRDRNTLNLESFMFNLGGRYRSPWFDVVPLASAMQLRLDDETLLRTWSFGLRLEKEFTPTFKAYVQSREGYQKFHPIRTSQVARLRRGPSGTPQSAASGPFCQPSSFPSTSPSCTKPPRSDTTTTGG